MFWKQCEWRFFTLLHYTKICAILSKRNETKLSYVIGWILILEPWSPSQVGGNLWSEHKDGNQNVKKALGLMNKTTTLFVHHTFFCTFLYRHCTTTTWKWLCFFLGRNSTSNDEFFFLFLKVYKALRNKFNSRKVRIHLTKWAIWNNSDDDWKTANSLFKARHRPPLIQHNSVGPKSPGPKQL